MELGLRCSQREAKLRAMEAAAQADKEEDAAREKRLAALEAHIAEDAASDAERERLMAAQAERIRAMDAHIEAD